MKQNSGVYVKVLCQRGRTKCGFGSKVVKLVYTINVTLNIHDVALLNTISSMIHAWVCMTLRWMPPSFECRCRVWILPIIWMTPSYNECPRPLRYHLLWMPSPRWMPLTPLNDTVFWKSHVLRMAPPLKNVLSWIPPTMNAPVIWMAPPYECPRHVNVLVL